MKKVILGLFLFLLAIAIFIVVIANRSFNADSFRQQLVDRVQEITGRTLTVRGASSLVWKPIPTLTLKDVVLSNVDGSNHPEMLKMDEMQIQIEWTSLFEQPTKIKKVTLKQPELFAERISAEKTNLKFAQLFRVKIDDVTQNLLGDYQRNAQIDEIELINGSVHYEDAVTKTAVSLESVHGKITLKSLNGPMDFNGRALWDGMPLDVSISLGALQVSQPLDVKGHVSEPTSHTVMDFFGQLFVDDPEKYFKFDGNITTERPNEFLKLLKLQQLPEAINLPSLANFKVELTPTAWVWENVTLRIGDTDAATALSGNWTHEIFQKKLDLTVNVISMDYDAWADFFKSPVFAGFNDKFSTITGAIDVEKLIVHNSRVENVHLKGTYRNNNLRAREFSCLLPGGSSVQAHGNIRWSPTLKVSGSVDMQSDNVRDLLRFLNVQIPEVDNVNLLRKGVFNSTVNIADEQKKITIENMSLDDMTGSGSVTVNADQSVLVDFALNRVNLDAYLGSTVSSDPLPLPDEIKKLGKKIATLSMPAVPVTWNVTASNATWRRIPIKQVQGQGQITPTVLAGSFIIEDMATANIGLGFDLQNVGTNEWALVGGNLSLVTGQLDVFLRRAGLTTGLDFFDSAKQVSLEMTGSGAGDSWQTQGIFKKQSLDVEFNGGIKPSGLDNMHVELTHPDFRVFMHSLDNNFADFPGLTGALQFKGAVSGTPQKLSVTDMTVDIGNQQLSGAWTYAPDARDIEADLTASSLNLSKFLPELPAIYVPSNGFSDQNFAIEKLSPWTINLKLNADQIYYKSIDLRSVNVQAILKDKMLNIPTLSAVWGEGNESQIRGSGRLSWNAETPELDLGVALKQFPMRVDTLMVDTIGLTKGILNLDAKGHFVGYSPKDMVSHSSGQGSLSISNAIWVGADIAAAQAVVDNAKAKRQKTDEFEPALTQALLNGKTEVRQVKADFSLNNGDIKITNGEMLLPSATVPSLQVIYHMPTEKVEAKASLSLLESMPRILYSMENIKRLNYYADASQFAKALEMIVLNMKKAEEDKKVAELQTQAAANLKTKKAEAANAVAKLKDRLNTMEQQLIQMPNDSALEYWKQAQSILLSIAPLVNKDLDSPQGYMQIVDQANTAQNILTRAEETVFNEDLSFYQKKAEDYLTEINGLLLEMNDFYYKRKEISILSSLIQGSEEQKGIISRASVQLKRHLTPEQARKVYSIIEDAFQKVQKAHQYAHDLYVGKERAPDSGAIRIGG